MIQPHSLLLWLISFHDKKDPLITSLFYIDSIFGAELHGPASFHGY